MIPHTPRTCIKIMAEGVSDRKLWEKSWSSFYNIYFDFIKVSAQCRFRKYNWSASPETLEDTVALVFKVLLTLVGKYDAGRGRFHQYLRGVVRLVVLQVIKSCKNDFKHLPFDETYSEIENSLRNNGTKSVDIYPIETLSSESSHIDELCLEERTEAMKAIYLELIEETKAQVSPRIAAAFDLCAIKNLSAADAAKELGISSSMVDNDKYKFLKKLNAIAATKPFKEEIESLKLV